MGSGQGAAVLAEAGLDGRSQYHAIKKYLDALRPKGKIAVGLRRAAGGKITRRTAQPKARRRG